MIPTTEDMNAMRGTVLGFDPLSGEGVISSEDGARVAFSRVQFMSPGEPLPGRQVDFEFRDGQATGIFILPGTAGAIVVTGDSPERKATIYGAVSLACAIITYLLGPLGLVTVIPALIFGLMGRNAGRGLADRTGYYLSVVGLVLAGIALAFTLIVIAMFAGFLGLFATAWSIP